MAKKLMIVDEQALARHLVRQVAALPQDTVLECESPHEALKVVGIFKPDCVVMGVAGPRPETFQAIRNIRDAYPQVRVVAVSQAAEPELRRRAADAGAASYVSTENLSELFLVAAPERLTLKPHRRIKNAAEKKSKGE